MQPCPRAPCSRGRLVVGHQQGIRIHYNSRCQTQSSETDSRRSSAMRLSWCSSMRLEHVGQELTVLHDPRALVQHHALGAAAHDRVADLGAGRRALLGEAFEHLGRPDHGHVRRLAEPEDLLLHLGRDARSRLPPRGRRGRPSRRPAAMRSAGQQDARQVAKRGGVLDLEHDPQVAGARAPAAVLAAPHVLRRAQERQRDQVRELHDFAQVGAILVGQRAESEFGVGEVDALFRAQPGAAGAARGSRPDLDHVAIVRGERCRRSCRRRARPGHRHGHDECG